MDFTYITGILLLVFGFGFVIFWHELGHFLAAKWAGVRVEQFAVGFGQALLACRKGIGVRVGTTRPDYERRCRQYLTDHEASLKDDPRLQQAGTEEQRLAIAAEALNLGETEYRLNWIPLGGYVKMTGQDDLRPNAAVANDPKAYNNKSIGQRMVIVSAGVVMNIILAAILFCVLFLHGFNAPPAVVGAISPGSPAQAAGIEVGDRILTINGRPQHDFTKITLNVALAEPGKPLAVEVLKPDGRRELLTPTPRRQDESSASAFLQLGLSPSWQLKGPPERGYELLAREAQRGMLRQQDLAIRPGEVITHVQGQAISDPSVDYPILSQALQQSRGRAVEVTVRDAEGNTRNEYILPTFVPPFGQPYSRFNFLGMIPRTNVLSINPDSAALGKLRPGDVVTAVETAGDPILNPTIEQFVIRMAGAAEGRLPVTIVIEREGQTITFTGLSASSRISRGLFGIGARYGLGIAPGLDFGRPVVAQVLENSPAHRAGVPRHAQIMQVNGQPVETWHDVVHVLRQMSDPGDVELSLLVGDEQRAMAVPVSADDLAAIGNLRYVQTVRLHDRVEPRRTNNPLVAAGWGVTETRDLILQFYLTLQRMVTRDISPTNLMGPVGIFHAGANFAYRGHDWLIWFLAMISANLAVVNFLPIPIVDGGLFVFLIMEKIKGGPISPRTQAIAQVVGLALILSLFLFVTYQDILRLVM